MGEETSRVSHKDFSRGLLALYVQLLYLAISGNGKRVIHMFRNVAKRSHASIGRLSCVACAVACMWLIAWRDVRAIIEPGQGTQEEA